MYPNHSNNQNFSSTTTNGIRNNEDYQKSMIQNMRCLNMKPCPMIPNNQLNNSVNYANYSYQKSPVYYSTSILNNDEDYSLMHPMTSVSAGTKGISASFENCQRFTPTYKQKSDNIRPQHHYQCIFCYLI